jgi:hypothetical protein
VKTVRVLASARDPGGAAQVRAVCLALRGDPRLAITVAASGPAFDMLDGAGLGPLRFALPDGSPHVPAGGDPSKLLDGAGALIERVDPDVLLVGISSLGVGLDEALLARAGGRPSFALQDFPGDANAIGGAYAGTYFVRDEAAGTLTRERFGLATVAVGSLRHAAYAALDVGRLRASGRARLGAAPAQPVLGFFAQPPEIPGHETAFGHLADALARRSAKPIVLLREHPKFADHRERHAAALRQAGVTVHDAAEGEAEPWLAACDVLVTCFSHCSMDYAFLSAYSGEPIGSVVFLLTTDEIRHFMRAYAGVSRPDGVVAGLGSVAECAADVEALLTRALSADERERYHAASRRLPREARVDLIAAALVEAGRRRPDRSTVSR